MFPVTLWNINVPTGHYGRLQSLPLLNYQLSIENSYVTKKDNQKMFLVVPNKVLFPIITKSA